MPPKHKPWWKADADADESPKIAALPNPAARWAWFRMMCRAKTQRYMGVFGSEQHLKLLLGMEARYVRPMVGIGLLHTWPVKPSACDRCAKDYAGDAQPGNLVVHDFRREQRDPTAAERQAEHRGRTADSHADSHGDSHGDSHTVRNGSVTPSSRALSPSLSTSSSPPPREDEPYQVGTPPEADPLRALAEELTGQPNALANVWGGLGERAIRLARKHGLPAVEREWRRIAAEEGGMPEVRQLVFGADEALNRIRRTAPVAESAEERDARELAEIRALAARNIAAGATR
jgi:hypothetical protein